MEARDFVFSVTVQTCPGAHPPSSAVGARGKVAAAWHWLLSPTLHHDEVWVELCPWVLSVPVVACCGVTGTVSSYSVFKKNEILTWSQSHIMKLIYAMKTVTVLKKDYVCFIKHKLNWERKKFTDYYLCCDIHTYIYIYMSWQAVSGIKFDYKAYQMWPSIVHLSAVVHYLW